MSGHRRRPSLLLSTRLGLAFATVLALGAGTAGVLTLDSDPAPVAEAAPVPAATAPVAVPPVVPVTIPVAPPVETAKAEAHESDDDAKDAGAREVMSAAECDDVAMSSSMSNADLRPYLRSLGCEEAADGLLVGAGDTESSSGFVSGGPGNDELDSEGRDASGKTPGDYALEACREQTGQTTAQCKAQSARGEAN